MMGIEVAAVIDVGLYARSPSPNVTLPLKLRNRLV